MIDNPTLPDAAWPAFVSHLQLLAIDRSRRSKVPLNCPVTPANGAGLDGFFGWVLIRVLLDGWKRVTL